MTATVGLPSGAELPLVGFGTWQLAGDRARSAVACALEAGYRHLDTASMYANEREVGAGLRDSGVPRDEVFVTTKLWPDDAGHPERALRRSLDALGLDALDLYLIHWPPGGEAAVGTWERLRALRDEGLVRDIGVSNYDPAQVDELVEASGEAPAVNQVEWSPFVADPARLQHARERGVVLEGYSPFRSARLDDPALKAVAEKHGKSAAQVIVRWHVDTGVVVIPRSSRHARIQSNFDVWDFELDADDLERLGSLAR